jgi:hypothetical protein
MSRAPSIDVAADRRSPVKPDRSRPLHYLIANILIRTQFCCKTYAIADNISLVKRVKCIILDSEDMPSINRDIQPQIKN